MTSEKRKEIEDKITYSGGENTNDLSNYRAKQHAYTHIRETAYKYDTA